MVVDQWVVVDEVLELVGGGDVGGGGRHCDDWESGRTRESRRRGEEGFGCVNA